MEKISKSFINLFSKKLIEQFSSFFARFGKIAIVLLGLKICASLAGKTGFDNNIEGGWKVGTLESFVGFSTGRPVSGLNKLSFNLSMDLLLQILKDPFKNI